MNLSFTVYGVPQPQGSARAFMRPGGKFPIVTSDNPKNKPWRQEIAATALNAMQKAQLAPVPEKVPLRIVADFFFDPPKSSRRLTHCHKTTRPDGDKLLRSLLDALTGIVFKDDSQVSQFAVRKFLGSPSRVVVWVSDGDLS